MALALLLAGAGLCLVAVAVGMVIGSRREFRHMAERMADDAGEWLARRAGAA